MKAETRFIGNGNVWVGDHRQRGWQVTCSRCGVSRTVTNHQNSMLPPNVIVKKLLKSGWYIGHKPEEDLCVGCRKKPKPNGIKPAIPEPPVGVRRCLEAAKHWLAAKHYEAVTSCLDAALRQLDAEPVKPAAPVQQIAPVQKAAPVTDADYEQWLKSLPKESD
jgi:hypothetical protein